MELNEADNCRLCFTTDSELIEIFSEQGNALEVSLILQKHFWFEVYQDDSYSKFICTSCWTCISNFHELYMNVEQKYKIFYNKLEKTKCELSDNDVEYFSIKVEPNVTVQSVGGTISSDQNDIFDDNEEFTNLSDDNDNEQDMVYDEPNHDSSDSDMNDDEEEYVPKKKSKRKSTTIKRSHKKGAGKKKPSTKSPSSTSSHKKKYIKTENKDIIECKAELKMFADTSTPKSNAQRFDSIKDNVTVRKYFAMLCEICNYPFKTFLHAKRHHLNVHNQNGYLMCCDRKFFKLYRVIQHCMWHENPETFRCEHCSKCFADTVGLRDHINFIHTPEEERTFRCDQCPKSYVRRHMLMNHKRLIHIKEEDKKFACDICGQRYIILPFLTAHIKKVHQNGDSRICDICAKFFKCSKSYETHYISMHTNIQQKVQCELCGKWLKHAGTLKEHMRKHVAKKAPCQLCGHISSNIKALRAHVRSAHRDPSFPCTVCNKLFKKTQTLKEHMAIHSGRTDLYTCTFCPKTFRSSANMYAHRKRSHPVEYEANKTCGLKYRKPNENEIIAITEDVQPQHQPPQQQVVVNV